jgi:hypothetical protein
MSKRVRDGGGLPPQPWVPGRLDVNQQDYITQLNRALGLLGMPPGHLEPLFGMSFTLDDFSRPEFLWLRRGVLLQTGELIAAAGAGTYATVQMSAPGSAKMVVVESVTVSLSAAGTVMVGLSGLVALTNRTIAVRDARATASSALVVSSGTPGGVTPAGSIAVFLQANTPFTIQGPWVLTGNPLLGFTVACQTQNTGMAYGITWSERSLLPQEL